MFRPLTRNLILATCTAATFLVLGRAPGAVSLRTRDIEAAVSAETTRAMKRAKVASRAVRTKPA